MITKVRQSLVFACDRDAQRRELGAALAATLGSAFRVELTSSAELPFAVARVQPDLVLIDIADPPPTANALASLLRDARSDAPVVLLSEQPEAVVSKLVNQSGAAGAIHGTARTPGLREQLERFVMEQGSTPDATPIAPADVVALARTTTRRAFLAVTPYPFLVGMMARSSVRADHTLGLLDDDVDVPAPPSIQGQQNKPEPIAWAIRKVTPGPAGIIRVGRTADNDLVIPHSTMSKLHAFFQVDEAWITLKDAGSRNGTWAGGQLLVPNGAPSRALLAGDLVRFGDLELTFTNAAGCWDMLRVPTQR